MKKINFFAIAILGLAVLFAGCSKNDADFDDVKTVKVSDVTTVDGAKVQQKATITDKAQFDAIVMNSLEKDFDKAVGLAVSGDKNAGRAAEAAERSENVFPGGGRQRSGGDHEQSAEDRNAPDQHKPGGRPDDAKSNADDPADGRNQVTVK